MQTYSLLFLDIDGTLLTSSHQVMPRTQQLLQRLEQRGIPVILCSARPPAGVETVERQAGLHGPSACCGGTLLLDTERNILGDQGIQGETAVSFKRFVQERFPAINVSAYLYDVWLVDNTEAPDIRREAQISKCTPLAGDLQTAVQAVPHVHKMLCMGPAQQITRLQNAAAEAFPTLSTARSGPVYLEVMPAGVSKGTAVERFCACYGVSQENTVAFGDHFVDVEMLRRAGLGIAMGNAPEEVRQAADRVTASNDAEGIYMALRHLRWQPPVRQQKPDA